MPSNDDPSFLPTRASLLIRLKDWNDHASWQDFFNTYWKLIYSVAQKSGLSDSEAQDVVQETMASVAKHMPTFTYDPALGSFKAWLRQMTRWRIIDQVRKRGPAMATPLPQADGSTSTDPINLIADEKSQLLDQLWETEWKKSLVDAALAKIKPRLEPQNYQVFDFYVNKGWAAEKVAETFSVKVNHVFLTKHRITNMIKAEVERLAREMI